MLSVSGVNYVFIHNLINVHCLCPEFLVWLAHHAWCYNLHYSISSECSIKCFDHTPIIFYVKFGQNYKLWKEMAMMFKQHCTLDILLVNLKFIFLTFLFQQLVVAHLSHCMHACICPSCFHTS